MLAFIAVALISVMVAAITANVIARSSVESYFRSCQGQGQMRGGPTSQGALDAINKGFLIASAVAVVLGLAMSVVLAFEIAKPVRALTDAADGVARGDYSRRVSARGGAELVELSEAFNSLAGGLETNETLRRNMVADIAHELRNPLALMRARLEAMQDGVVASDSESLSSLAEDVDVLSRLVDDLHQLSLAEAGQLELSLMAVDAGELVEAAASRHSAAAAEEGVDIAVDIETGLPPAKADPVRIAQVLSNLIKNAVTHTPRGGQVTLRAGRSGSMVQIQVEDTGSGIGENELPFIFERFYRTEPARERATGGAGIGLTVARSLVEAHGGRISARSAVGSGTTVSFTIPVAEGSGD